MACSERKSRGELLSTAEVQWSTTKSDGMCSFPLRVEQVVRSDAEKAASKAKAAAKKRKAPWAKRRPGRPKGSKNTPKADVTFTPELLRITSWLDALLQLIAGIVSLTYLVLDGHFGNHNALQMARQSNLH